MFYIRQICFLLWFGITVFPCLNACSQMTAWSRRSDGSKEDIMIICLLNNEFRLSAGAHQWLKLWVPRCSFREIRYIWHFSLYITWRLHIQCHDIYHHEVVMLHVYTFTLCLTYWVFNEVRSQRGLFNVKHIYMPHPRVAFTRSGVWSFVLFNDAWSQKGHSVLNTTAILTSSYLLCPLLLPSLLRSRSHIYFYY